MSRLRLLLVVLCLLVGLVILVWPRHQEQVEYARRGDLELYLKCPYTFEAQAEEIRATQNGSVLTYFSEGERVKLGEEICAVRNGSQVSYTAPTAGFVTYLATPGATVNTGTPLAQILPTQGILTVDLTPEQARNISQENDLQVLFPFSAERVWVDVLQIGKGEPGCRLLIFYRA
jgi:predicted deacylase